MHKIKYTFLLMALLFSVAMMGQNTGDFNPVSPPEPDEPNIPIKPDPPTYYTLTLLATEGGSIKSGAGKYEAGKEVTVTANAAATNFVFVGWTMENPTTTKVDTISRNLSFTYTMPQQDMTLTACYMFKPGSPAEPDEPNIKEEDPTPKPTTYALTLLATEGGSIKSGAGKYEAGKEVTVTANAAATNFVFIGWTMQNEMTEKTDTISKSLSFTYTMPEQDMTLTACYLFKPGNPAEPDEPVLPEKEPKPIFHKLTVSGAEGGTISVNGSTVNGSASFDIAENKTAEIKVALATNFVFEGWYMDDVLISEKKDFSYTMDTEDVAFIAKYRYSPTSPQEPDEPVTDRNELYMMSMVGMPGETINFPIYLNSNETITAASFFMQFPKGITIRMDDALISSEAGEPALNHKLMDAAEVEQMHLNEAINAVDYNTYLVELTDMELAPTHTPLMIIPTDISSDIDSERFRIWLSQATFTKANGEIIAGLTRNGAINTAYEEPASYAYLDNLINVGTETIEFTQPMQKADPTTISSGININKVLELLGCSGISFTTFKGLAAVGYVTNQQTADNGYWFGKDGFVRNADATDKVVAVAFNEDNATIDLTQAPNALNAGDIVTAKVYFTYQYRFYETIVQLTVEEAINNEYSITYIVDDNIYLTQQLEEGIEIPAVEEPTKVGYTFKGWENMPTDKLMPAQDLTLKALWEVNSYTITFDTDGGSTIEPLTQNYATTITKPANPTKIGHTFIGWSPEIPTTMPEDNITVKATWQINSYEITYILDEEEYTKVVFDYNSEIIPVVAPDRIGRYFDQWQDLPNTMPAQDVTVYGYTHVTDQENVVLDGVLKQWHFEDICKLQQVRNLDISQITNTELNSPIKGIPTLRSVIMPFAMQNYGDELLNNCPSLLEVKLNSNATIPATAFLGSDTNTNLIVYAPQNTISDYQGLVVINGMAGNIVLKADMPLQVSESFTAQNISYTKEFTKLTYLEQSAGWETLMLPFDVQKVTSETRGEITPFHKGEGDKHFWLCGLTEQGFGKASRIKANIPYIIAMPNSDVYIDEYNITGNVTFSAENAIVMPTANTASYNGKRYDIYGTYEAKEGNIFTLNMQSTYDETTGKDYYPGGAFVDNAEWVRPFEAYVIPHDGNGAKRVLPVFDDDDDDATNMFCVYGVKVQKMPDTIYDVMGRRLTAPRKGLNIINGRKVLMR